MTESLEESALGGLVRPGSRVALGDGCGTPPGPHTPRWVGEVARGRDDGLVLGWMPLQAPELDATAFADVRVLMGGPGTRAMVEDGSARWVPARLSAVPALLTGPLRPDLLVATVVRRQDGWHFGTEVAHLRGLVAAGVPVAAVVSSASPCADAGPPLPDTAITVVGETDEPPGEIVTTTPTEIDATIARNAARLVPEGDRARAAAGRTGGGLPRRDPAAPRMGRRGDGEPSPLGRSPV